MNHLIIIEILILCINFLDSSSIKQDLLAIQDAVDDLYYPGQPDKEFKACFDTQEYDSTLDKLKDSVYLFIIDKKPCIINATDPNPPRAHYLYSCVYEILKMVNLGYSVFQSCIIPQEIQDLHNKSITILLNGIFSGYIEPYRIQNKTLDLPREFISEFWPQIKDENTSYSPFAEVIISRKHKFESCLKDEEFMRAFVNTSTRFDNALSLFKAIYLHQKFFTALQGTEVSDEDIKTIVRLINIYDCESLSKNKPFKFLSERDEFDFSTRVITMLFNIFQDPINTELEYQVRNIVRTLIINAIKSSSYSHLADKVNDRTLQALCSKMWDLKGNHEFFGMSGGVLSNALTLIFKQYHDEIIPLLEK